MFNAQSAHNEIIAVQLTPHDKSYHSVSLLYAHIHAMESPVHEYALPM